MICGIEVNMIEISLKSSDLLYLACAISEVTNPRAVIQIIPGVKEHKSRYNEFIMELNNNGFNVFISDIRGHGRSINGNYPLGYIDDYQKMVEDQNIINDFLRNRYPGLPIYMLGDSIGAEVALGFIQKYDNKIDKLALISPLNHAKNTDFWISTARLTLKFQSGKKSSSFLQNALGDFSLEKLAKDNNERERIKNDALCNFSYSNMAIGNMLLLKKDVSMHTKYQGNNKTLPIMIMFGALDEIGGGRDGIKALINILNKSGYTMIGNLEYANMMHKILFETGRRLVYNDLLKILLN